MGNETEPTPTWVCDWLALGHRFGLAAGAGTAGDEDQTLRALSTLRLTRVRLDDLERRLILASRDRHVTWRRIADALGVSTPQAAQQRYLRVCRPGERSEVRPDAPGVAGTDLDAR